MNIWKWVIIAVLSLPWVACLYVISGRLVNFVHRWAENRAKGSFRGADEEYDGNDE